MEKCKGTASALECSYCKKMFSSRAGKSQHLRICQAKKELDEKALVVHEPSVTINGHNNTNITNQTNIENQNNNTVINNNIIVFNSAKEFIKDHITKTNLKSMLNKPDYGDILTEYFKHIMKHEENQCVRKTNLRSTSSAVHVGNNVWEAFADKQIYPKLLCNVAINFSESIENCRLKITKEFDSFIEDITCDGQHGTDDKDEIKRVNELYKRTISNVIHIIFNVTKQALAAKQAKSEIK
jgi:hypothetical protein